MCEHCTCAYSTECCYCGDGEWPDLENEPWFQVWLDNIMKMIRERTR